jgi:putative ABC transport system substrate-binding protein
MRTMVTLHSGSNAKGFHTAQINGLMNGLAAVGVDSTNTTIRPVLFAKDNPGRKLRDHADDLVAILASLPAGDAKVFVAAGGSRCARAAMGATAGKNIPVVFTSFSDPDPPAPNMTGVSARTMELDETRLRLLHEYLPAAKNFGVLVNSARGDYEVGSKGRLRLDSAAGPRNLNLNALDYQDVNLSGVSIQSAFQRWAAAPSKDGALVTAELFFNDSRDEVVAQATIPAIYQWREFVEMGGLMSYGPSINEAYTAAGKYAGRILKGETIAQLPVVIMTRFELVINQGTATALRKPIPQTLRDRATVIP